MKFNPRLLSSMIALCAVLFLTACQSNYATTKVTYENTAFEETLDSILVISLLDNPNHRLKYEKHFVESFNALGVKAISAHNELSAETKIDKTIATELVEQNDLAGAIVVRLSKVSLDSPQAKKRTELVAERTIITSFGDIFRVNLHEDEVLRDEDFQTSVVLITDVFSITEDKKIASMETIVSGVQDQPTKVRESVDQITQQLLSDDLLSKK